MSWEPPGTCLLKLHLYFHWRVETGKLSVLSFDGGNIKVGVQVGQEVGVQVGQEVDLIQKVVYLVEPLVGQRVGSGGYAFEIMISMQIGLGKSGLGCLFPVPMCLICCQIQKLVGHSQMSCLLWLLLQGIEFH